MVPIKSFQEAQASGELTFKEEGQDKTPVSVLPNLNARREDALKNNELIRKVVNAHDDPNIRATRLIVGWYKADKSWASLRLKHLRLKTHADKLERERQESVAQLKTVIETADLANVCYEASAMKVRKFEKILERTSRKEPTEAPNPKDEDKEVQVKKEGQVKKEIEVIDDDISIVSHTASSSSSSSSSSEGKRTFALRPGKVNRKYPAFCKPFGNLGDFPHESRIDCEALKACFDNTIDYFYNKGLLQCEYCRKWLYEAYSQDRGLLNCYRCCRVIYCSAKCAAAHDTHKYSCIVHPGWQWQEVAEEPVLAPPTKKMKLSEYSSMPKSSASKRSSKGGKGGKGGRGKGGKGGRGKGGKGQGYWW